MPLDIHTGQFGPDVLIDPDPEAAWLLRLLPLDWFHDNGIYALDYGTWAATESHYLAYEREQLDKLRSQIDRWGLLERIEISWHGPGYLPRMCNGHHRVVILRQLGWTHAPYRWYDATKQWLGAEPQPETGPLLWTPPTTED